MSGAPWTKRDITLNLIALISLVTFASFILIIKNWIFLLIYGLFWVIYIFVGRYVTCRHCDYLGKPCPSWNMGLIASKLYTRSDKKNFAEAGLWKLFVLDILPLMLADLYPIIIYFAPIFTPIGLTVVDWYILGFYITILLITLYIHQTKGCNKCNIKSCPLSKK